MEERRKSKKEYRALYPGVSDEIIDFLQESDRKMAYFTKDLKEEKFYKNEEKLVIYFIPSREDSLERLQEDTNAQFGTLDNVEEEAIKNIRIEQLNRELETLDVVELELIDALFRKELTQRAYAECIGKAQSTVSKRLKKLLEKLGMKKISKKLQKVVFKCSFQRLSI
ncbi:sigma-70 family RNA polymerase sigma factor [Chakrabartyella piscis]|uniref:sigma-70 family RNA polymerase sigma factor n=1 Tax=Chakrabartyella piscis TaxID=2918914 RepID=UPI00295846B5|nr:sigma-70 family RNA polymerase sigma factor [Chakrabartyella piscis]